MTRTTLSPILLLRVLFASIFLLIFGATVKTSLKVPIWKGGGEVLRHPWGVMTLLDAYLGFLTFYVWVAYRERSGIARVVWFVLIMLLGNIAMSLYVLIQLFGVPRDARIEDILLRKRT